MQEGLVIKSTGSWYSVQATDGMVYTCRIRGKLKIKGLQTTNPIAVGDIVHFEPEYDTDATVHNGMIADMLPRRNYIIRRATNLSRQSHIIAANLDLAAVVVTLAQPRTALGFIDRFLVTAEAYHIPALLLFNKLDMYAADDIQYLDAVKAIYENIGYKTLSISGISGQNIDQLTAIISNKTTLFSGHSGVGKSTLINNLLPNIHLRTTEISDYSGKGVHTTTFAEMFDLPTGGKIIDTPGIKELGIVDIPKEELAHYFPEMKALMSKCRFNNCKHIDEPNCAITQAVSSEIIDQSRYESYLSMMADDGSRRR